MLPGRIFVTFKPSAGKNIGDVSRRLDAIEEIIEDVGGTDFMMDPYDQTAFRFILPVGIDARIADDIVQRLAGMADHDGQLLLEAERGWKGQANAPDRFSRNPWCALILSKLDFFLFNSSEKMYLIAPRPIVTGVAIYKRRK